MVGGGPCPAWEDDHGTKDPYPNTYLTRTACATRDAPETNSARYPLWNARGQRTRLPARDRALGRPHHLLVALLCHFLDRRHQFVRMSNRYIEASNLDHPPSGSV